MRAVACVLLLSGLLAGLAEGYSVKIPYTVQAPQVVVAQSKESQEDYKFDQVVDSQENEIESIEQDDKSFIASQETEEDKLWTSDEDPDWKPSESQEDYSQNDDGSFIASEETEEGELWASDDDPDWTPSESQEDDGEDYSEEYDYSQEDYSGEDDYSQEDYSGEDDYSQEDYSGEDDYSQEDYSGDDDSSQEDYSGDDDDSQEYYSGEYDQTQEDSQEDQTQVEAHPFPQVPVLSDHDVKAEYWNIDQILQHLDDGSSSQEEQEYSKKLFPLRSKREVKRSYTSGQQVVQVPGQQVVKVPLAYGGEQGTIDSGLGGAIYEGEGGRPEVSTGVEPLLPVGGPPQHEVAAGVEPEVVGSDRDTGSFGSSIGDWFQQGWGKVTGAVGDLGDKVEDVASQVHDKLSDTVDKIHQTYHGVRDKISDLVDRFKVLIRKFGVLVQEGVRYCLRRFDNAIDKVQEAKVFEKLERELEEGHAEVAKFFQILGEKIKTWREQHSSTAIDSGLIGGYTQEGQSQLEEGPHRQDIQEDMPDFFQDPQVLVQLNKLADVGVLTEDDIIILTEEHVNQIQQNQHQNQQDQQQNQNYDSQQQNQQQSQQTHQQQSGYNPKFIHFPE